MKLINLKSNKFIIIIVLLTSLFTVDVQAQIPGRQWEQYQNVTDAGFSEEKLALVSQQFNNSQGSALMVVHSGKVVIAHGDITRRYMVHSIRKAFMNALYGIYVDRGTLNLDATLQSMGIDDINPLTSEEKKATIEDLLSARSGVYLPSSYSPRGMEKNLPERGSHASGAHWYYNNWDFNVLHTIFEQQSGKEFSKAFAKQIAEPIEMEDFRQGDIFLRYEKERSIHPAYLFNMSTRDMARFGVLYLNNGKWKSKQVVPANWILKSTSIVSSDLGRFADREGFGYLWWVSKGIKGEPMYYTSGSGGHRIIVLPQSDLVVVHRANTYEGRNVSESEIKQLVEKILEAKSGAVKKDAATIRLTPSYNLPKTIKLDRSTLEKYTGSYKHPFLGYFKVRNEKHKMFLDTNVGVFRLFATSTDTFFPEDLVTPMQFVPAPDKESKYTIKPMFSKDKQLQKAIMYY
ncbi:serine hydrolase [Psychroserpens luteolus]|uniref:serine hydrolase n=1 Tax=Psychroserpens luteolus TaxID=2855840 RepID=UPI001E43BFDA|nr:serine hydrolase [Psychroserpens luteolus]MCD2259861.1 serine hydrolase [Psychroserpens luteolus]